MRIKNAALSLAGWVGRTFKLTDANGPWGSLGLGPNFSGEPMTPAIGIQIPAVWRAIRLTAETLATLPMNFYTDDGSGPRRVTGTPADNVCRVRPNIHQTPIEFWTQILACQELVGNGYAKKLFIGPRLVGMVVLNPARMTVLRDRSGNLWYDYVEINGTKTRYSPRDILHLKGFSLGGDVGLSPLAIAHQTLGLSRAAQRASGSLFKSGLRAAGFITSEASFGEGQRDDLEQIVQKYVSSANAGSVMILEGGMKYESITMNAQDAELLMTRKFEIEEIGRFWGMPPILLGHAVEGQTMWGSGVEQIISSWLTLGLYQRIKNVEAAINFSVIDPRTDGNLYCKINGDALMRMDSKARAALYSTYVQNGLRTRNEVRAMDELPGVPGGDDLTVQVNLVPIGMLGQNSTSETTQIRAALLKFLFPEGVTSHESGE